MKRAEMITRVAEELRRQFKIQDRKTEMRAYIAAEKIVKTIIEPTVKERENTLLSLFYSRRVVHDS
jgi:hypothetical protein